MEIGKGRIGRQVGGVNRWHVGQLGTIREPDNDAPGRSASECFCGLKLYLKPDRLTSIAGGYLKRHLPTILRLYRPRQEAMLAAMDRYFPAGFNWSHPEGGMFLWAEGPEGLDAVAFNECCIACNVAFVPGKYFFTEPGAGLATMRFNYTMIDEQAINDAVRTVAEVYTEQMSIA